LNYSASDFLAGVGAGVIEAIFAVTPMESIKTITIEKHLGVFAGMKHIWKEYGIGGFYKGAFATILKQSSNQVCVRSFLKYPCDRSVILGFTFYGLWSIQSLHDKRWQRKVDSHW
jgi:hypothetical protein